MAKTRDDLLAHLETLGINAAVHEHPPLFTVSDSQALRGTIPGHHTKNLFLRDKKGSVFLVSVGEDQSVDLKQLHKVIGASGRLSFGSAELLMDLFGVRPGAVSLLCAINDMQGRVTICIDETLMQGDVVNCHPLTNEATVSIAPQDLLAFLRSTGHEPKILKIAD